MPMMANATARQRRQHDKDDTLLHVIQHLIQSTIAILVHLVPEFVVNQLRRMFGIDTVHFHFIFVTTPSLFWVARPLGSCRLQEDRYQLPGISHNSPQGVRSAPSPTSRPSCVSNAESCIVFAQLNRVSSLHISLT
ncbi:hypothetical protein SCLCIDRAFT_328758 [Scleroderma citrinum Foug A]|uniref:Uncharacterized protein n=1 Tax=Scleroderma citrinum Foug A TaxID=1036808 RepID=A0A0C3EF60_9AGAM|nr:hypothetical protein SCLCIDRAFT_328758 [Scleroderma citrinum Foug A]